MPLQWILVALIVFLSGCAGQPIPELGTRAYQSPDVLLDGTPFGVGPEDGPGDPQLLAVNDEMRAFLAEHVPEKVSASRKVELIVGAILASGLRLQYDNLLTLPASEAFNKRAGNCMSFTNLFLALAREAGVRANYQEVLVPPTWTEGDRAWFYNLHVNVLVDLPGAEQVVDFNMGDYMRSYPRRVISDEAGEARHHNNIAVHWMTHDDPVRAFLHFRRALELQPGAGHVWTNLGTLYRREGMLARAEGALLRAVDLDREPVAMSNLARLYEMQGLPEAAEHYAKQVDRLRARNPYYQFHLAEVAYEDGDYVRAQELLERAIRRKDDDHRFHHLMAMIMAQRGETDLARRFLREAGELAEGDGDRDRYSNKLDLLASG